ncbi:hypothetical protein [Bacillus sp. Hm123]|uniref:hypothetical protein n=1 Tax=Bacillus sp. Hm123 TaxID=3450745 RepID=UPI003F41FDF2
MKEINVSEMSDKVAVRLMMDGSEYKTFKQLAEELNIDPNAFRSTLNRNTLRVKELRRIAALLGYTVKLEKNEDDQ